MKLHHSELEESRMSLRSEVDNYCQELEEAKRDLEEAIHKADLLQVQLDQTQETGRQELQRKDFEVLHTLYIFYPHLIYILSSHACFPLNVSPKQIGTFFKYNSIQALIEDLFSQEKIFVMLHTE